jgi:TonB family protein
MALATGAILIAAVAADRLLERRVSAAARLLLYLAVLGRLALPAAWHSPLGVLGVRATPEPVAMDLAQSSLVVVPLAPLEARFGLAGWAAVAYAALAALLLGRWLWARLLLRRSLRACRPAALDCPEAPVLLHERLGPLVAGLLRPRIVVPAALADGERPEALAWVLRHEGAHVRRRDPLMSAGVQIACILAWPILPLWLAARRIRALMEQACDERAVEGADSAARRRYGELLLALAEGPRPLGPALAFGSPLRGRLRALAARRRWPLLAQAGVVAAVVALAVSCAGEPPEAEVEDAAADASDAAETLAANLAAAGGGTARDYVTDLRGVGRVHFRPLTLPASPVTPRFGVRPTADGQPRLLPELSRVPTPHPGQPGSPGFDLPPARFIGPGPPNVRQVPRLFLSGDGSTWLMTRRSGMSRLGASKPLEPALREALAETGSRTVILMVDQRLRHEAVVEAMAAARRAGATGFALETLPQVYLPKQDAVRIEGDPQRFWKSFAPTATSSSPRPVAVRRGDPVVTVTSSGGLLVGGTEVTPETLEQQLRWELERQHSDTVLVRRDPTAKAPPADLMDIIRRAGAKNVPILAAPSVSPERSKRNDPVLTITPEGKLFLGTHEVAVESFEGELRRELQARGSETLLIRGDKSGVVNHAMDVMALAKRAGARNLALLTERTPSLDEAQPPAAGSFDKGIISATVREHIGEAKACYERELAREPSLRGRVLVRFTVSPEGVVIAADRGSSTMNSPALEDCLVEAVKRWRFPPPQTRGDLIVVYPFIFNPQGGAELK